MTLRERLRLEHEADSPCGINWPDGHERHQLMMKGARTALEHLLHMDDERPIDAQDVHEVLSSLTDTKGSP